MALTLALTAPSGVGAQYGSFEAWPCDRALRAIESRPGYGGSHFARCQDDGETLWLGIAAKPRFAQALLSRAAGAVPDRMVRRIGYLQNPPDPALFQQALSRQPALASPADGAETQQARVSLAGWLPNLREFERSGGIQTWGLPVWRRLGPSAWADATVGVPWARLPEAVELQKTVAVPSALEALQLRSRHGSVTIRVARNAPSLHLSSPSGKASGCDSIGPVLGTLFVDCSSPAGDKDVVVTIPETFPATVETESGPIRLEGSPQFVRLVTVAGSVELAGPRSAQVDAAWVTSPNDLQLPSGYDIDGARGFRPPYRRTVDNRNAVECAPATGSQVEPDPSRARYDPFDPIYTTDPFGPAPTRSAYRYLNWDSVPGCDRPQFSGLIQIRAGRPESVRIKFR
ncbi:MAG: hypothetical protein GC160_11640 [Acidobacteria bacterium]|nr:hypothetical protein [Acidobacteriota bacterium]